MWLLFRYQGVTRIFLRVSRSDFLGARPKTVSGVVEPSELNVSTQVISGTDLTQLRRKEQSVVAERYGNVAAKRNGQRVGGGASCCQSTSATPPHRRRNKVTSPLSLRVPRRDETRRDETSRPTQFRAYIPGGQTASPAWGSFSFHLTKHELGIPVRRYEHSEQERASISWVGKVLFDADHVCDRHVAWYKWMGAVGRGTNRLGTLLDRSFAFQLW